MSRTAFIFPGQGSQYAGMGRDFYENFQVAKDLFDQSSEILGWDVPAVCFGNETGKINLTEYTQPAILVVSIAAWQVLQSEGLGVTPAMVAGHSLGEYSALVVAGGIDFSSAVSLVQMRGKWMQASVPEGEGLMSAILGLDKRVVEEVCRQAMALGTVSPANYNSPGQVVIAGVRPAVEQAGELAKARGAKKVIPLQVSVPSHCILMKPAAERLMQAFDQITFRSLKIPLVTNVDACPIRESGEVREALGRQLTQPVRWDDSVSTMISGGCDRFVEVGPGKVLSSLVKRIAQDLNRTVSLFHVDDGNNLKAAVTELKG